MVFITTIFCILITVGFADEIKSIKIVDEQGNRIGSFQCMARWKEFSDKNRVYGSLTWKKVKSEKGLVEINIENLKVSSKEDPVAQPRANGLDMLLMADGYAPESFRCRFENIPDKIVVEKPVTVYLAKKDETVPGNPAIVPKAHIGELFYQREFPLKVKKVNPNKWECKLKKGQSYIIGWKTGKKGWFSKELEGYCSESFTAEKDGQIVNFEPGMPVTFQYDLSKAPKFLNVRKYPVHIRLDRIVSGFGDEKFWFSQKATIETKKKGIVQIPSLAAGNYYLTAYNSPGNSSMPHLSDRREIVIAQGKECRIEPVYPTLDTTIELGDVTIKGTVLDEGKNPVAKEQVSLWSQRFDENKRLIESDIYYKPVRTDRQGKFRFKGVLPGRDVVLSLSNHSESIFLARNSLKENVEIEVSFVVGQKDEVVTVGKPFVFPMVRLENNEKKDLNEFKGKIIVIDIWASWCSPCIRSMPELSKLAEQMQPEDIKFITLSTDSDQHAWKERLSENNWAFLLHTWFDNTINYHKLKFNGGIPFYVIIDEQGIVRVAGNGVDIKSEIEKIQG